MSIFIRSSTEKISLEGRVEKIRQVCQCNRWAQAAAVYQYRGAVT